jgi:orotate phosphoribosyltransferase
VTEMGALALLEASGAILTGRHIVYTSGKHGSAYVNKDAVYPHTTRVAALGAMLADAARPWEPEVVCGPALGGIVLSQWTAHALGVPAVFAEKAPDDPDAMVLARGYDRLVAGRRVLVVEDVLNTGLSVRRAVAAVRAAEGTVVGVAVLCNRGGVTAEALGVPALAALVDLDLEAWDEAACPLCREGVPVSTDVGKGRAWLAARGR